MTESLWRSLTVRFISPGYPLREAEQMAAAAVIDCLAVYLIMGYCPGDAGRERLPVAGPCRPAPRSMDTAGHCGAVPAGVGRDGIFSECQPGPALPAGCGNRNGSPGAQGILPAVPGMAAGPVRW